MILEAIKMKQFLLVITVLLLPYISYSQNDSIKINMKFRVQKDAVLLRWAANTPMAWKQTNLCGFQLVRYTIVKNGEIQPQPEKKILADIKAKPLAEWENIVKHNDYAAIIAQALYGESFDLSETEGIARIIALSEELEQRYTFSLYAADQSFEAACMAGWGWKDENITEGERYLYRVIPLLPENSSYPVGMGSVYVVPDEYDELSPPVGLSALFGDKSALLAWDYGILSNVYNSYYIEKSADGKNFRRLDGIPATNMNNRENETAERMYFIDSLADNYTTYYYRITGTTAFGETGPPSEVISGKGKEQLSYVPYITKAIVNDDGELHLEWKFDEQGNNLIKGFELNLSDNPDNNYEVVVKNISPERRSLVLGKLNASNYFTISAVPNEGQPAVSFPVLVQPIDSIPPAIPGGLTGKVDSNGIVTLTWKKNTEPDLLGYKVFRGQTKGEELVSLFDIALQDTVFIDTVDVRNLNKKVYYAISSVDMRYNQSDLSPVAELEKPDLIPPSSPVISGYKITDAGIEIEWVNSPDFDVVQHRLYRREKAAGYSPVTLLKVITDKNINRFTDTSAITNVKYEYTITSLKENWLESDPSNKLTAFTNKLKNKEITRFDAIVDKENRMLKLTWSDNLKEVFNYEIYKSENGSPLTLWKKLPGTSHEVLDEQLVINTTYKYIMRAILKNGKNTGAKELIIKY